MTTPPTQPPNSHGNSGIPLAPAPNCFPVNAFSSFPIAGAQQQQQPAFSVSPNLMQQFQLAQQQAMQQASMRPPVLQTLMNNGSQQFFSPGQFVATATAAPTTNSGTIPQSQLSAPVMMVPQVPSSNANATAPALMTDPNTFAYAFQQQILWNLQAIQQEQQKLQAPQQAIVQPQHQPSFQSSNMDAAPEQTAQACATVIQRAFKDPQFAAAGHVLLQTMQSSSAYMNSLMNQPTAKQVDAPKTIVSQPCMQVPPIPIKPLNQVFLGSSMEPVKREDSGLSDDDDIEEEMWKSFFLQPGEDESMVKSASPVQIPSIPSSSAVLPVASVTPMQAPSAAQPSFTASTAFKPAPTPFQVDSPKDATSWVDKASPKIVPARAECGKIKKAPQPRKPPHFTFQFQGTPQQYLMAILKERDYSINRIPNAESGYQSKPTPLQCSSFGTEVVNAATNGDVAKLSELLDSGLSPNPCNQFGDFLIHQVCRRGHFGILKCFVDHGCPLEVCDSFGRTPLHGVAWAGEFCEQAVQLILDAHWTQILVEDNLGKTPLEYVRASDFPLWIDFLRGRMDTYWPIGGADEQPPRIPCSQPVEPEATISLDLATAVASGQISPQVVASMDESTRKQYKQDDLRDMLTSPF